MRLVIVAAVLALLIGGGPAHAAPDASEVLLAPWTGPYGGYPPFDRVKVADFKSALEAAMTTKRREIDAIANDPAPPTFANTIEALERSGQPLARVLAVYQGVWANTFLTPEYQAVQAEMDPKLAAFTDEIVQNPKLFARIEAVYASPERAKLSLAQQRLVWIYWNGFVRSGARLDPKAKPRVAEINGRLASLFARFGQNLQADEDGWTTFLSAGELGGLPESVRTAAAEAARERGHPGEWAITNTRSSIEPFLTFADDRALRERVWRNFYGRGDHRDAHDNSETAKEILKLRYERARLLGFSSFADWKLADKMIKTPDQALALLLKIWPHGVAQVRRDVAEMQALADRDGGVITIEPWDYRYYAEKVRKAKYAFDEDAVRQYLQLDHIRDALFWEAGRLYGFSFAKVETVPVFHPDVTVYEVTKSGRHVALLYFDPYARPYKTSGAWNLSYRWQSRYLDGQTPIVSLNTNFVRPAPGQPALVGWNDAVTLFHEFGHVLHNLNSSVDYPTEAGAQVAVDYLEFPGLMNEQWLSTPEILSRFAVDAKGGPIPSELVAKIRAASTFSQGFAVTEVLAGAIYDLKIHLAGGGDIDPDRFEAETLAALGLPRQVVMRHRPTQFAHIFAGDAYAAGFYSYVEAEVLAQDAFEFFRENGGPYDKDAARRFRDLILAVGNSVDPAVAYRRFRGRDAKIDAYLKAKGFAAVP